MTILFWIFIVSLVIFLILFFGEKIKALINYKTYEQREELKRRKLGYNSDCDYLNELLKKHITSQGPYYRLMPDGKLVEYHPRPLEFTTEEFNNLFKD